MWECSDGNISFMDTQGNPTTNFLGIWESYYWTWIVILYHRALTYGYNGNGNITGIQFEYCVIFPFPYVWHMFWNIMEYSVSVR